MQLVRPPGSSAPRCGRDVDRLLEFIHAAGGAGRKLRALLDEHVRSFDLLGAECLLLWLCATRAHHAGWAQQDLANAVGISPAQMSTLVEGLRQRGLMEMKRSTIDRRRQVWRLLAQGEELLDQIRASLGTVAVQIDGLIPAHEQQAAHVVLAKLAEPAPVAAAMLRTFDPDRPSESQKSMATDMQGGSQ